MNKIIDEVHELKSLILNSKEYSDYKNSLEIIEKDERINKLIDEITNNQKELVKMKYNKQDYKVKEDELNRLYDTLNSFDQYKRYIEASKKLNVLITNIQTDFQEFFDNLVC